MSVLWAGGNMRGPRLRTPVSLLLLLLLGIGLRHTVLCQDEDSADPESEIQDPEETEDAVEAEEIAAEEEEISAGGQTVHVVDHSKGNLSTTPIPTTSNATDTENEEEHGSGENSKKSRSSDHFAEPPEGIDDDVSGTEETPVEEGLDLMVIIIPAAVVVLIIAIIVCGIFIHRRLNRQTRHSEVSKDDPYLECSSTEKVPMPMFEEDVPSVLELEMDELDDWMKKDGETADGSKQA